MLSVPPVPPIQTVKGRVVFFRTGCEKISTLKPLTVWIFAVAFRRRKRGTGFQKSRSPFPSAPFYGKTSSTTMAVAASFCGAARPAPPASPKEQNGQQGLYYTSPPPHKAVLDRRGTLTRPFSLPVRSSPKGKCVHKQKSHLTKRFMGQCRGHQALHRPQVRPEHPADADGAHHAGAEQESQVQHQQERPGDRRFRLRQDPLPHQAECVRKGRVTPARGTVEIPP